MSNVITPILLTFSLLFAGCNDAGNPPDVEESDRPVIIYSTDLTRPPGDPDDHFDLLTLFSMEELDIRSVILDYAHREKDRRRGRIPNVEAVSCVSGLFNRKEVPCHVGLRRPLNFPGDGGLDFPENQQRAIEHIISILKSSADESVFIITTGSLRDICAAYNRVPGLFRRKVKKLIVSVGDSYGLTGLQDTNTSLDPEAWKGLMTSGLPIDWMPCNPSKGRGGPSPFTSYWYFIQHELKPYCAPAIDEFLLSEGIDLSLKQRADGRPIQRHMWSTPAFIEAAGLDCYRVERQIRWLSSEDAGKTPDAMACDPYEFFPIRFSLDDQGVAVWEAAGPGEETNIRIFRIKDYYLYNEAMFRLLTAQFGPEQPVYE